MIKISRLPNQFNWPPQIDSKPTDCKHEEHVGSQFVRSQFMVVGCRGPHDLQTNLECFDAPYARK